MKFRMLFAVAALLSALCSCQKINEQDIDLSKEMTFKVSLGISQEPLSRATLSEVIGSLVVYDFLEGDLVKELKQSSTNNSFGKVNLTLSYGTHKLVFVGHSSTSCAFDNNNTFLAFDKVTDTFVYCLDIEVDEETSSAQTIVLERQVAGIELAPTDAVAPNAASIEITIQGYSAQLNPASGEGSVGEKFIKSWEYEDKHLNQFDIKYLLYSFLPSDDYTIDFGVRVLDKNGNEISNNAVDDVSIEKNKKTVIAGEIFSTNTSATVSVNDQWGTQINKSL